MEISIKKAVPICCAIGMTMVLMSSCMSTGLGVHERRVPVAVVADAGPEAVTPVGMAEESFETVAPEPTPILTPKPVVYLAVSPVRTVTIEPTINEPIMPVAKETPKPAVVKREVAAAKKKSGLFGWLEKKKSRKATVVAYVPYSGPVPETNVAVKTKAKPVAVVPPKPVAVASPKLAAANQVAASKKKKSGIFDWMGKKKSRKTKTTTPMSKADTTVKATTKPVAAATPKPSKPAAVQRRTAVVEKKNKYPDGFASWLQGRNR